MEKYHIEKLIDEEEVMSRVRELAKEITNDYKGKPVHIIGTLKGSIIFMGHLLALIDNDQLTTDFICASSYGSGMNSSGNIRILKDLDGPIEDKDVIIVEDIVDTGNTMKCLIDMFKVKKPHSIKICTLLDKPSRRIAKEVKCDYVGFTIDDIFVAGFGMDYAELHRNLPYVGKVVFD